MQDISCNLWPCEARHLSLIVSIVIPVMFCRLDSSSGFTVEGCTMQLLSGQLLDITLTSSIPSAAALVEEIANSIALVFAHPWQLQHQLTQAGDQTASCVLQNITGSQLRFWLVDHGSSKHMSTSSGAVLVSFHGASGNASLFSKGALHSRLHRLQQWQSPVLPELQPARAVC